MLDVAVVGAGVGGCYCAHRLVAGTGRGGRVEVFERTDRVGGRLWSAPVRAAPDLVADLGAMRVHRGLRSVIGLIRHLGLEPDLTPFTFDRPENLVHLRGAATRRRAAGRSPDDLVAEAAERLVPGFAELRRLRHEARSRDDRHRADSLLRSFHEQRDRARLARRPLDTLTWTEALEHAMGATAVAVVHDAGGYDVRHSAESAAARLDLLFRTPPDAEYLTLRHGMQALSDALHARFTAAGGVTRTGHRLVRLAREPGEDHYRLTFAVHDGRSESGHTRVLARSVLLALPPEALRGLDPAGLPLARCLRPVLDAIEPVPAFKLFLVYPEPWWRSLGITHGRSTTDTELRQLWYGGTCSPANPTGSALLLAAYPSGRSVHAWDDLRDGVPHTPAAPAPTPGRAMVDHAHALLARVHGATDLPDPVAACWADWSRPPHGAAWHVRRPGHGRGDTGPRTRQPLPRERVHLVSDSWTADPGSIEGTLASAEDVLRACFGLPAPPWHAGSPR
ncbi:NAD(P)/FAD-dependent oxidoreductase [Actinosynnema sp. NPDC050801]|uniref:flavin monoamine oxidase family protein n=1 Tax=unclassified Actinosynnema TaxID=2637065 RepID=UPI00340DDB42